jgi:hypothetical protein
MRRLAVAGLALAAFAVGCSDSRSALEPEGSPELRTGAMSKKRVGSTVVKTQRVDRLSLSTQDLTTGLTPEDLAQALVGQGITISNVSYSGAPVAAGTFAGGTGIIGFEQGVILSTGCISNVVGPNEVPDVTCENGTPGDPDLEEIAGEETFDAAILEFDFVPTTDRITFQYVFASDEYNEFVGSQFNDVFGFFVNGVNYALVGDPAVAVTINTINEGQSGVEPTNPELYRNNDPFDPNYFGDLAPPGGRYNTEMDGLTVVLTFEAPVNPGVVNRLKLAIADAADEAYDSNVFIRAGTLAACTPVQGVVYSSEGEPGEIRLGDPWLFVEVFDVERYLPRTSPPNNVRLGPSFAAGTPAESFTVTDINNDGNRDVRVRFSMSQLIDSGHISTGTTQINVWGQDPQIGELFCMEADVDVSD